MVDFDGWEPKYPDYIKISINRRVAHYLVTGKEKSTIDIKEFGDHNVDPNEDNKKALTNIRDIFINHVKNDKLQDKIFNVIKLHNALFYLLEEVTAAYGLASGSPRIIGNDIRTREYQQEQYAFYKMLHGVKTSAKSEIKKIKFTFNVKTDNVQLNPDVAEDVIKGLIERFHIRDAVYGVNDVFIFDVSKPYRQFVINPKSRRNNKQNTVSRDIIKIIITPVMARLHLLLSAIRVKSSTGATIKLDEEIIVPIIKELFSIPNDIYNKEVLHVPKAIQKNLDNIKIHKLSLPDDISKFCKL